MHLTIYNRIINVVLLSILKLTDLLFFIKPIYRAAQVTGG